MNWIRTHLSSAHAIALLALFVALGGVGYAAATLPKNSVGSKQIKRNAVTSSKVKNGSLLKRDFRAGQLPAGPRGPQGIQGVPGQNGHDGAQGPAGEAAAFARVQADGTLLPLVDPNRPAEDKNVDQTQVTHPAAGTYCIDLPFAPSSAMVALDNAGGATAAGTAFAPSVAIERGNNINPCTGTDARILMTQVSNLGTPNTPVLADHAFFVWFEK